MILEISLFWNNNWTLPSFLFYPVQDICFEILFHKHNTLELDVHLNPHTNCVTCGKLYNLSLPQFLCLKNGDSDTPYLTLL